MKRLINKNLIDTQDLVMPLSNLMADTAIFAVTSVRDNYAYEEGKKQIHGKLLHCLVSRVARFLA